MQRQQKQQRRDFDVEQFGMMMDDEDDGVENQMLEDERAAYLFDRADRAGAELLRQLLRNLRRASAYGVHSLTLVLILMP